VNEKQFQQTVVTYAKYAGWDLVYHTHDSRRSEAGFPDLVMVRAADKRVIYRELKTETGKLTRAQKAWIDTLQAAGADADVWRPRDLHGRIPAELARAGAR
jgi:hypothetical protein